MEPLDPVKNQGGSGYSKRRISSILKRKSIRIPDPEEKENKVEFAKPVERRASRRVSFAAANDVLLFSKDVQNTSPVRSPLQESLTTAAATPNGVQVAVIENGDQQITGMETLLNAPLHASQYRDKVSVGMRHAFGEKTVMFASDDAFMDMTQSHTIHIAKDGELLGDISLQNNDVSMDMTTSHTGNMTSWSASLPTGKNVDLIAAKRSVSTTVPSLDLGLKNFLYEPSGPCISPAGASSHETNGPLAQIKTKRPFVDKENRAPFSVSAVMDKSLNACRNIGQSSNACALRPEDDVSMDMTEAQTGHIQGSPDNDDDAFRWLFPSQEMYSQLQSQTAEETKQQPSSKTLTSFTPKDMTSSKNPIDASHQQPKVILDTKGECREKTIIFSAGDEFMDMTRSHTVNISPENDVSMDMTKALTGRILEVSGSDEPFPFLLPTQDMSLKKAEVTSRQQHSQALGSSNYRGMEKAWCAPLKTNLQRNQVRLDAEDDCREKTVRFTSDDACMDVTRSHTVNIVDVLKLKTHAPGVADIMEKPVNKTTTDCPEDNLSMDMTEAQTGQLWTPTCIVEPPQGNSSTQDLYSSSNHLKITEASSHQNSKALVSSIPDFVEIPNRSDNIDSVDNDTRKELEPTNETCSLSQKMESSPTSVDHDVNCVPTRKSRPMSLANLHSKVRRLSHMISSAPDAIAMESHTVPLPHLEHDMDENSEDKTKSLPDLEPELAKSLVNTEENTQTQSVREEQLSAATPFNLITKQLMARHSVGGFKAKLPQSLSKMNAPSGKVNQQMNTTRSFGESFHGDTICPENDVSMDMTKALTGRILEVSGSDEPFPFLLPTQDMSLKKAEVTSRQQHSQALGSSNYRGMEKSWCAPLKTNLQRNQVRLDAEDDCREKTVRFTADDACMNVTRSHTVNIVDVLKLKTRAPGVADIMEKPVNNTTTDCPEDNLSMDMTEAQTGQLWTPTCIVEPPQGNSSTQDLYSSSNHLKITEASSHQNSKALVSSIPDFVEIPNRSDNIDSVDNDTRKELEPTNETCSLSQKMESSPTSVDHDVNCVPSRKSRPMSLANLHSKVRRLSHMISSAPVAIAMESHTVPLPHLEHDMDENSEDKTKSLPDLEPELAKSLVNTEENTQTQSVQEEQLSAATPFNLKTKQLMSRLSVGGFKAKLPQRSKPEGPRKVNSVGEHTKTITVNVTNQLSSFDNDVSDIYDEELGSYEDMSEMLDTRSPQKTADIEGPPQEFNMDESLRDNVLEQDFVSSVHGKNRPLPEDENNLEDEKGTGAAETSPHVELGLQSQECDDNITTAQSLTTQTTDYSNSIHSASIRCEATFEPSFKQSLFESQLEDYANDAQRKFDDGIITVLEFFKLFNIDFVIHNPRQSILPGRLLSDTDCTAMDLLKDRHITRPKQLVYQTDVHNLTEKVEGLKVRMQDLDTPLNIVNRTLWEEMRNLSEKEFKSFGAKLKERKNFFRKTSKVRSHEMKEGLYSNLAQANLETQQRLRGSIESADQMIKSLDDCILELETELHAVEEKGSEGTPSLKSCQEELQKVTEALADNNRQISEFGLQKKQNTDKVNRLKAEKSNLENHVDMLHTVNEWKLEETKDNCTLYTFLYETLELQVVYTRSTGNDADNQSKRKISNITFKHHLDHEKSKGHTSLVHKLLSQHIEGETAWVEKYPTRRHVPKLLHDVGLVVSRCRLLGEELRLLKMWGSLRLDILHINCVDTQVHIVFSSLKKFAKFEVIFSVSLTNQVCVFQVQSFKNIIGSTTIQQIEEVVASFSPGKKLLTKIIKKIHESLQC